MADSIRAFLNQHLAFVLLFIFFLVGVIVLGIVLGTVLGDGNDDDRSVEEIHVNRVGCIVISEGEAIALDCDWDGRG